MKNLEEIIKGLNIGDIVLVNVKQIYGLNIKKPNSGYVGFVHELSKDGITLAPYQLNSGCSGDEHEFYSKSIRKIERLLVKKK